ncbi:hypothetical protein RCL_jg7862.t1 [Rhizophagus clarus]|uniref:Uncharacterized protein n=1 Tax=Rhizophagus clarus TaxID=94130 RepID=A0A8H3R686_9GLOM|nr:hypothetical protein RCL_jg7862.t1 [Rhizophagus clarus]
MSSKHPIGSVHKERQNEHDSGEGQTQTFQGEFQHSEIDRIKCFGNVMRKNPEGGVGGIGVMNNGFQSDDRVATSTT